MATILSRWQDEKGTDMVLVIGDAGESLVKKASEVLDEPLPLSAAKASTKPMRFSEVSSPNPPEDEDDEG